MRKMSAAYGDVEVQRSLQSGPVKQAYTSLNFAQNFVKCYYY